MALSGSPLVGTPVFSPQVFQAPLPPLPEGEDRFYPPTLISGAAPTLRCLREPVGDPGGNPGVPFGVL